MLKEIKKIADKYKIELHLDNENCDKNYGASSGNEIFLGVFDNLEIMMVAFFHELGHCLSNEYIFKRGFSMSTLSAEGTAWELGLGIAFEHGYQWDYYSEPMRWARKQLRSYIDGEYDDTKR